MLKTFVEQFESLASKHRYSEQTFLKENCDQIWKISLNVTFDISNIYIYTKTAKL